MKRSVASVRNYFPSFGLKLSKKAAASFVVESLLLFLFASTDKFGFALALALFCGLVYARQNILTLAPIYILACCVFSLGWWTLLFAVCPLPLFVILYAVYFKLKKNVPLFVLSIVAFLGAAPYLVTHAVYLGEYALMLVSGGIVLIGSFVLGVSAYAVLIRGFLHTVAVDELIAISLFVVAFAYAIAGVTVYDFNLYFLALAFFLIVSSQCFKSSVTLVFALLMGLGCSLCRYGLSALAASVLLAGAASLFSPFTKYASALATLATQSVMCVLFAHTLASWQTIVMTATGLFAAVIIKRSVFEKLSDAMRTDAKHSFSGVVNRRGRELAKRLNFASDVFFDLSKKLEGSEKSPFTPQRLAREIALSYCAKCADRASCMKALGGDTACVILPMAEAALSRGKVNILDVPPFIASKCSKVYALTSVVNSSAEAYLKSAEAFGELVQSKKLMSEQFAGVSLVFDSLARECSATVSIFDEQSDRIKAALLKHNIYASEVVISKEDDKLQVTVEVREDDAKKVMLKRVLSSELKAKLDVDSVEEKGDNRIVYFVSSPIFEVAYGIAERTRESNDVSGDSRSILCPSRTRRLFAICDGMGSGKEAAQASNEAVEMIENFYRAGIDSKIILSLVNKLLKLSLSDCFTSIDISVIDASSGALDVIKSGASASFIVRKDGVEVLSCSQPPAGILDSVRPSTSRYQLYDGDIVVMTSDGVFDALEASGIVEGIESVSSSNPQTIADGLMERALARGAQDDCTVLCMRLFSI